MKLTKRIVESANYDGNGRSRKILWDDQISGFGCRVFPSQKKSFVLSYRVHGRKHLLTLGQFGLVTLDQARTLALIKMGEIASGVDPLSVRKRVTKPRTISELSLYYLENYSKVHKKSWREDERRITRYIIPAIGSLPVMSLQVADVTKLHIDIGVNSKIEANRTVELLRAIIEEARDLAWLEPQALNPAKGVKRFREKKRDRWLRPEELPRVAIAINNYSNIHVRAALWLYLLTGLRKTELLTAKWANVDFHRRELRVENTKSGNDHVIPLTTGAVELLKKMPRALDNPFVIPGAKGGSHLVNINKAWRKIRTEANVADLRLHDLRRTVGSWLAQDGATLHLIGQVLNHASSETTKVYARLSDNSVRTALESYGSKLLEASRRPEDLKSHD